MYSSENKNGSDNSWLLWKYPHMLDIYVVLVAYVRPGLGTLREESSQTNVILQYLLLASIMSAVCSVIQQS